MAIVTLAGKVIAAFIVAMAAIAFVAVICPQAAVTVMFNGIAQLIRAAH